MVRDYAPPPFAATAMLDDAFVDPTLAHESLRTSQTADL